MDFTSQLDRLDACYDAVAWVGGHTLAECYSAPDVPPEFAAWLVGRVRRHLPTENQRAFRAAVFSATDRAVRTYAPQALESAGLLEVAARLRALPHVVDVPTARAAKDAVELAWKATQEMNSFPESAWTARWAADAAQAVADWESAAWSAGYEASAAGWHVAAARGVGAEQEECRLQLEALREAVPLEVLRRALDSATREATPEQL